MTDRIWSKKDRSGGETAIAILDPPLQVAERRIAELEDALTEVYNMLTLDETGKAHMQACVDIIDRVLGSTAQSGEQP